MVSQRWDKGTAGLSALPNWHCQFWQNVRKAELHLQLTALSLLFTAAQSAAETHKDSPASGIVNSRLSTLIAVRDAQQGIFVSQIAENPTVVIQSKKRRWVCNVSFAHIYYSTTNYGRLSIDLIVQI